ncbi:MAG TPA: PstS family phosphate ABC transporter substrate-binding protein [Schlesneria sp.]|jgi:phosphate transport system substrate-binding protein
MAFGRTICGFSAVAVASMLAVASMCGGCIQSESKVEPTVNVEGSSTVFLISQAMANEFEKKSPYKVSVGRSGTGGGYKKFVLRQCDLWNASRPIAEKEEAELKEKGIEWLELEVGIDGISVAVHPQNDWCTELTVGQLRKIWEPDSTINKWSDLDPNWPDQPMELYGADTDSGTFEYFTEVIVGKKNSSRTKYQAASDDNVLIQGVAGSKYALGYIPYGYCVENKDKIKVIKVSPTIDANEAAAPAVEPTVETILTGEYKPLARPLFVYANVETLKRPEIADFLKFTVSEESQPLVAKRGFVRIPEEKRKEMETRLETALKATSK